jgi:hypothetical protein
MALEHLKAGNAPEAKRRKHNENGGLKGVNIGLVSIRGLLG